MTEWTGTHITRNAPHTGVLIRVKDDNVSPKDRPASPMGQRGWSPIPTVGYSKQQTVGVVSTATVKVPQSRKTMQVQSGQDERALLVKAWSITNHCNNITSVTSHKISCSLNPNEIIPKSIQLPNRSVSDGVERRSRPTFVHEESSITDIGESNFHGVVSGCVGLSQVGRGDSVRRPTTRDTAAESVLARGISLAVLCRLSGVWCSVGAPYM